MNLMIHGHTFRYEMERLTMMFFPLEKIHWYVDESPAGEAYVLTQVEEKDGRMVLTAGLVDGEHHPDTAVLAPEEAGETELALGRLLYRALSRDTGITPPWGTLTGVRPVKLLRDFYTRYDDRVQAERAFENKFLVSPQKMELARRTEGYEAEILRKNSPMDYSLYVSIPFCPTRCLYCSFVSHGIQEARKLMPQYLAALGRELEETARMAKALGLKLTTVYFGGGTPTTLTAEELDSVMTKVSRFFDLTGLQEYTVEAGRPDTITREKLEVIRKNGGRRISVNPQTFRDDVLERVGRKHTVQQFLDRYQMAREVGFDCINMDLIAGLPGDDYAGFCHSIDSAIALAPDNITLHTLSIKRAADLGAEDAVSLSREYNMAVDMVDYGYRALDSAGYHPYYLYRQRNTAGNLENTGFARPGKDGFYNVYSMAETQTILAVGAGAVSKAVHPITGEVFRVYNHKYPYEYIDRYRELMERKHQLYTFFK